MQHGVAETQHNSKKVLQKMDDKTSERQESTDQRRAAEADAVFIKLIKDLHTCSENPLPPEEVLKRCKEKAKK